MPSPILALGDDLLLAVLGACDFCELCALLATSKTLASLVPVTLRSPAWLSLTENRQALLRAAWDPDCGSVVESCLGGFDTGIGGLTMCGGRIVCFKSGKGEVKVWDSTQATVACTHAFEAGMAIEAAALRGSTLALLGVDRMGGDLHTYLANLGHVPSTDLGSSGSRASAAAIKTAQLDYGLGSLPGRGAGGSLAWARSEVLVTVRFGPAAQSEFDFWYNKGIEVSERHVTRGRPQDATRRASSELAWIQGARVLLAAHEDTAVVLVDASAFSSEAARVHLLSLPSLDPLRTMPVAGGLRPREIRLNGSHVAMSGSSSGGRSVVMLWRQDVLVHSSSSIVLGARGEATGESKDRESLGLGSSHLALPNGMIRDRRRGTTMYSRQSPKLALGPNLLAAAAEGHVVVWDTHSRTQLCSIGLPSRQHAHFHRNVIVPNSLSWYGEHLAIDDRRIALTAACQEGDWREELTGADGVRCFARSLLVVQEMGPEGEWWCSSGVRAAETHKA
jgi:hypothetical protein